MFVSQGENDKGTNIPRWCMPGIVPKGIRHLIIRHALVASEHMHQQYARAVMAECQIRLFQ